MKFLLVCTLILGLAFFMASGKDCNGLRSTTALLNCFPYILALPQLNNEAPMVGDDHHHHPVVRSVHFAEDVQAQHKHDDVACCG